jgi:ABC-type nitrate/sulfonate/bicarbonate transport system permease component
MSGDLSVRSVAVVSRPKPGATPSALRRFLLRHRSALFGVGSIFAGFLLWQAVALWIIKDTLFLVAPTAVIKRSIELSRTGELQHHTWTSSVEFFVGFGIAAGVGIFGGLILGTSKLARTLATPWISALYSTPTVALSPLLILWFGIGLWSKIVVVFIVSVFPVLVNTQAGIEGVDTRLVETALAFGARRAQIFTKVLLPSAVPFIIAGLRLGIGRGLVGVVVAELFGATSGLGYLITVSSQVFDMGALFAAVVILAGAGVVSTEVIKMIERRIAPWRA